MRRALRSAGARAYSIYTLHYSLQASIGVGNLSPAAGVSPASVGDETLHVMVPFLGWGLAMLSPIAIDRNGGRAALKQVTDQGRDRLRKGLWIVIFPEGTRVEPGVAGRYGIGGAWLATHTQTPVVPVAHNAGEFWGRNSFLKYPGTITMSIGAPIAAAGVQATDLNHQVQNWIETEMKQLHAVRV